MDTTTIIALYAAAVATGVLVWDIYKWKTSGPRVCLTVFPNIKVAGNPDLEGRTYVRVEVRSTRGGPTTILKLYFLYYNNWLSRLHRRPDELIWVASPFAEHRIPYVLGQGTVWHGLVIQDEKIEKMAKEGLLYCALDLSHSKKPKTVRVVLPPN